MATIKDVAQKAGVSVATVSRTLNNSGYVSQSAREKIEAAVKALDFHPNEVARSLQFKKSKLIGLLVPDIMNPFFPMVAKVIETELNSKGYAMILGNVGTDQKQMQHYLKTFAQNNVAGIISAVQNSNDLLEKKQPIVMIDRVPETADYFVVSDDYQGGRLAAEAILKGDPQEILLMAGPTNVPGAAKRLQGARDTLIAAGKTYQVMPVSSYGLTARDEVTRNFFEQYREIDSIIASNDLHAMMILQAALSRGISVPDELQVIGYDGIAIGELFYPKLTTIAQPIYDLGKQAVKLLLKLMNEETKNLKNERIILPVYLREGNTLRKGANI